MTSYDEACNDYHNTEVERTNNLNNMQKIITRLLKKGNVTVATQTTDDIMLTNMLSAESNVGGAAGDASELRHITEGEHHGQT